MNRASRALTVALGRCDDGQMAAYTDTELSRCGSTSSRQTWYWTVTMAKRNYLVEGLSGAGKSSVYEELVRRGYTAITTDRAWAYHADPNTGLPVGPFITTTLCGTSKKLSANSKARNQKCCLSVEVAVIATTFCPISPRYLTSASTTTLCVAASKSAPMTTGRSAKRESNLCSS